MAERYVETLRVLTQAWQCDHLGHVNVSFYMGWLGDAAFAMLRCMVSIARAAPRRDLAWQRFAPRSTIGPS